MENQNSTPVQNTTPVVPVAAPVVAPVATPVVAPVAAPEQPAVAPMARKASHRQLVVLLAVFAVMGGALAALGALKPDLVTSTFAWVTKAPAMHAVSSESQVLVNGQWISTSNPESELSKAVSAKAPVKKFEPSTVVETNVVVPASPETEPVVAPESETVPAENAEAPATAVTPDKEVSELKPESQPAPVAPATTEPVAEAAVK